MPKYVVDWGYRRQYLRRMMRLPIFISSRPLSISSIFLIKPSARCVCSSFSHVNLDCTCLSLVKFWSISCLIASDFFMHLVIVEESRAETLPILDFWCPTEHSNWSMIAFEPRSSGVRKVYLKDLDSFLVILFRVGVPSGGAVMSMNRFLLVSTTGCALFALELSGGVTLSEVALALTWCC